MVECLMLKQFVQRHYVFRATSVVYFTRGNGLVTNGDPGLSTNKMQGAIQESQEGHQDRNRSCREKRLIDSL